MAHPTLNYESHLPHPGPLRAITCFILLVYGTLLTLGGAAPVAGLGSQIGREPPLTAEFALHCGICLLVFTATIGTGVPFVCTIWGIQHDSRCSAKTALILALINAALVVVMGVIILVQTPAPVTSGVNLAALEFFGVWSTIDVSLVICLRYLLREGGS